MDVIIKTGFEKISHNIEFQPETVPKGKALVAAGHVRDVQEEQKYGMKCITISANVIRQTSVSLTPYATKLSINLKREVVSVSCTCVYNKSAKCKHIAAVIYYINHIESLTKTDHEQQWGKVSAKKFAQEKYSKGAYFWEMFPPKPQKKPAPMDVELSELEGNSMLKLMLMAAEKGKEYYEVQTCVASLLDKVEILLDLNRCEDCVQQTFTCAMNQPIYISGCEISIKAKQFYAKNVVIEKKNIIKLCCDTLEQSNCDEWFQARKLRISASKDVHSIKIRKKKTEEALLMEMVNPKNITTKSILYGRNNEKKAIKVYEKMYGVKVIKLGVLVSDRQPWLCASLDGVVLENDSILRIIEIKCPSSCQKLPIIDEANEKCNVKYLKFYGDQIRLKESSMYYTQCQVQMYVSGVSTCHLFIYSPIENGSCCVQVERDESFLQKVIIKSEQFYFHYYLPALMSKPLENQDEKKRCFNGQDISNQN